MLTCHFVRIFVFSRVLELFNCKKNGDKLSEYEKNNGVVSSCIRKTLFWKFNQLLSIDYCVNCNIFASMTNKRDKRFLSFYILWNIR